MKKAAILLLLFVFISNATVYSRQFNDIKKILIEVPGGRTGETGLIAIDRIREYSNAITNIVAAPAKKDERKKYDLTIVLGTSKDSPELKDQWKKHASAKKDSWLVQTVSVNPLVIMASGLDERATLYAAYHLADLLKAGADISGLQLFFQPKIVQRYVSYGTTTHGRRYHQPSLYYKNLKELPRYGYNGVLIYPGGGTPIGRRASPILETAEGKLYTTAENTNDWKNWFGEVKKYQLDILMTIPPMVPPGYSKKAIQDYYAGGPEPKEYIFNLKAHYKQFLTLLARDYPEIDSYLFNSTEGATFGRNERFFGSPDVKRFSNQSYLVNNEQVMKAYFDVLSDFFKADINKVSFWTHSFGLTSEGIAKMREILFQYPKVLILEDDYWNNNLWPYNIPAMKYLPEDLRARIHTKNPFGMFQIATDGEYFGGGSLPNAYPGSHIRSAKNAVERNARMVIQRLDLHDRTPYGTLFGTMEIVPIAASKQLWDPTPSEPEIWQQWADRRFGKQAAPFVINALQKSENILINGFSCNGIDLLANGSEFNPRLWFKDEKGLTRFNLFSKPGRLLVNKTGDDVIYSEEYTAYQMDTHTIAIKTYLQNQDSTLNSIQNGLKEIEKARPYLKQEDYKMLNGIFENGQNVINALRLLGETAYATNITLSNYDNIRDPAALFNKSITNLEAYIKQYKLIPEMDKNLTEIVNNYKKVGNAALRK